MKKLLLTMMTALALAGGATVLTQPALAQHAHGSGPHGGQIGEAEPFHVEMVTKQTKVEIYLYDENMKALRLDQFEVSATIQAGKQRSQIVFVGAGGNQMNAESPLMAEPGAKIIMVLKPKGKPQVQVRFGV